MAKLNLGEQQILSKILLRAIDEMSNNSCNDEYVEVTAANRKQVKKLIEASSFDEDDLQADLEALANTPDGDEFPLIDFAILQHFHDKLCPDIEQSDD